MVQAAWKHNEANARQVEQNEVRTPMSVMNFFQAIDLPFKEQITFKKKVSHRCYVVFLAKWIV